MFDRIMSELFDRRPEYDENGQIIGYSTPKIAWFVFAIIIAMIFGRQHKEHNGQKGGGYADIKQNLFKIVALGVTIIIMWILLEYIILDTVLPIISVFALVSALIYFIEKKSRKKRLSVFEIISG